MQAATILKLCVAVAVCGQVAIAFLVPRFGQQHIGFQQCYKSVLPSWTCAATIDPAIDSYDDEMVELQLPEGELTDEALADLFMQEIAHLTMRDKEIEEQKEFFGNVRLRPPPSQLVENPVLLEAGMPVELVYKKRLMFGNFVKVRQGNSIEVKLSSGESVAVDIGQIISIWDTLADEEPPRTAAEWAEVSTEALKLLRKMNPRKSDLLQFWTLSSSERNKKVPVDSLDLGIHIFQGQQFKYWLKGGVQDDNSNRNGKSNKPANKEDNRRFQVYALSSSQRYAAALLLFYNDFRFKRRMTHIAEEVFEVEDDDDIYVDDDHEVPVAKNSKKRDIDLELEKRGGNVNEDFVTEGGARYRPGQLAAMAVAKINQNKKQPEPSSDVSSDMDMDYLGSESIGTAGSSDADERTDGRTGGRKGKAREAEREAKQAERKRERQQRLDSVMRQVQRDGSADREDSSEVHVVEGEICELV